MKHAGSQLTARLAQELSSHSSPTIVSEGEGVGGTGASGGGSSARFILRTKTRDQHDATEAAFAPYDLSDKDQYRSFLTAHAMALPGLELAVTGRGWRKFHPRLPRLADDLAAMDTWLPAPMIASDLSEPAVWGTQYVLEGSKLGGRMICRNLPEGVPSRYLAPDPDMSEKWQAFCASFDDAAIAENVDWLDEAVHSAIETFQFFRRAASAQAEDIR